MDNLEDRITATMDLIRSTLGAGALDGDEDRKTGRGTAASDTNYALFIDPDSETLTPSHSKPSTPHSAPPKLTSGSVPTLSPRGYVAPVLEGSTDGSIFEGSNNAECDDSYESSNL